MQRITRFQRQNNIFAQIKEWKVGIDCHGVRCVWKILIYWNRKENGIWPPLRIRRKKNRKDLTQDQKDASGLVVFVETSSQMVTKHSGGSVMIWGSISPSLEILSKLLHLRTQNSTIRFWSTVQYHLESIWLAKVSFCSMKMIQNTVPMQ